MNRVKVDLGDRGYDVLVGAGLSVGAELDPGGTAKVLIVSDTNVAPLYADVCEAGLKERGYDVCRHVVSAGEESKAIGNINAIYDTALSNGMDRGSIMLALGGGVVGDMAGFAAATFMRGIRFIQAPTSLLAMVDSSVGGKTGVNIPQGKNLVGAFYQPVLVVADLDTLDTLPEEEYSCGLAEVVKYGAIWDADLFSLLEDRADEILTKDKTVMSQVVSRCCEIKAEVVSRDEKESGVRAILNYGHTLGHALEKVLGYGALSHGEAVAIGMVYASRLSQHVLDMAPESTDRLVALLERYRLPTDLSKLDMPAWDDISAAIAVDKKTCSSIPRFVLSESLGTVQFGCEVENGLLEAVYSECFSG